MTEELAGYGPQAEFIPWPAFWVTLKLRMVFVFLKNWEEERQQ